MGLTIDRTHIEHLAAFLSATGWQLIYGLNLGTGKAEQAAAEAEMVAQIVGPNCSLSSSAMSPTAFALTSGSRTITLPTTSLSGASS
jgi:hypothetical protein